MEKKQNPDLILAYSIIKYKYISEISKEIQSDCKVYNKQFPNVCGTAWKHSNDRITKSQSFILLVGT